MVKLLALSIFGFQSKARRVEIKFSDDQASVIYGDNGCGKTTFLNLIHAILNKDEKDLVKECVAKVVVEFFKSDGDVSQVVVARKRESILKSGARPIQALFEDSYHYEWSEFDKSELASAKSMLLGTERGVSSQPVKIHPEVVMKAITASKSGSSFTRSEAREIAERIAFYSNRITGTSIYRTKDDDLQTNVQHSKLQGIKISSIENLLISSYQNARFSASEKVKNALFDTLAVAINTYDSQANMDDAAIPINFPDLVFRDKDRIVEALEDEQGNRFKDEIITALNMVKSVDDVDKCIKSSLLQKLLANMINELQSEKQLLSSINTLIEEFNGHLSGGKKIAISRNDIKVISPNQEHSINALSSGERHLLTFLSLIVTSARTRDILIIDEPEISLNVNWQKNLMPLLKSLVPNTQIIVATHSTYVARSNPRMIVELMPVSN